MQRVFHKHAIVSTRHHVGYNAVLRCKAQSNYCTFGTDRGYGAMRPVRCLQTQTEAPINKDRGGTVMTDQLYGYLLSHTHEHEVPCSNFSSPACCLIGLTA